MILIAMAMAAMQGLPAANAAAPSWAIAAASLLEAPPGIVEAYEKMGRYAADLSEANDNMVNSNRAGMRNYTAFGMIHAEAQLNENETRRIMEQAAFF